MASFLDHPVCILADHYNGSTKLGVVSVRIKLDARRRIQTTVRKDDKN